MQIDILHILELKMFSFWRFFPFIGLSVTSKNPITCEGVFESKPYLVGIFNININRSSGIKFQTDILMRFLIPKQKFADQIRISWVLLKYKV